MEFVKKNSTPLIVGGSILSLALGYGVYHFGLLDKGEDKKGLKVLPREVVVKILKEMQKEFFGTFSSLAMIGIQIQQQSRNRIPPHELEYILSNQRIIHIINKFFKFFFILAHFTQEISEIENRIYASNSVSEKEFQNSCAETYKNDQ